MDGFRCHGWCFSTWTEPWSTLAASVDAMLAELGRPPHGESKVREWVGNGIERLVKRALTNSQDGEPEAGIFDQALDLFMAFYGRHTSERSRPYPGAENLLAFFDARKVPRVCITNKASRYTEALLSDLGWLGSFDLVLSGDSLRRKKPDPLPLLHAARQFGVEPCQSLMVGDSKNDVAAARAAGIPIVCVSYGYNHGEDIGAAGPDVVIDSLDELARLIA
jgi:phosphoglycolate phosphatase